MRAADHQTILVRRGVAFGGGLILLFVIVLFISHRAHNAKLDSLRNYNNNVVAIATDSQTIGAEFFGDIAAAQGRSAAQVAPELDALHRSAENDVARAQNLSTPGSLDVAQRDLLLALDLREEAVGDVATQIPIALGGLQDAGTALKQIAGDMEQLLASDVLIQVRVTPLVAQELQSNSISPDALPASVWVHDLSWLSQGTVASRLTGASGTGTNGTTLAPGTHGHALTGVSVGGNTLTAGGAVNTISSGANPTFAVNFQNTGQNNETDVEVEVSVSGEGKVRTNSTHLALTKAGQSYTADVTVSGVPLQVPASVTAEVVPVPGEKTTSNNKSTFTALFAP